MSDAQSDETPLSGTATPETPLPASDHATEGNTPPSDEDAPAETVQNGQNPQDEPETFPRAYVERLRRENAQYREKVQNADTIGRRLHTELVKATNRLADATDLPYDPTHLDDPDALAKAVDDLLERKPHLASRRPTGDIGQGQRGASGQQFNLLEAIRSRM